MSDWTHPDELHTPIEDVVHHPIGLTVRTMQRQIWGLLAFFLVIASVDIWTLYEVRAVLAKDLKLDTWRQQGRDISTESRDATREILERVRSHDHAFGNTE